MSDITITEYAQEALRKFGACIRGDWGSIDGRQIRSNIEDWLALAEGMQTEGLAIHWLGEANGCWNHGCWFDHCPDDCDLAKEY